MTEYKNRVVDAFVEAFCPHTRVFVRNNVVLDDPVNPKIFGLLDSGKLAIFHTSSEVEPLAGPQNGQSSDIGHSSAGAYGETRRLRRILGQRLGAPRRHARRPLVQSLPMELLVTAGGPSLRCLLHRSLRPGSGGGDEIPEFKRAFEFANRYVGYHASPTQSPGAWVAMQRENASGRLQLPHGATR